MQSTLFAWKSAYETGNGQIDSQHRRLVSLVSDLHEAMSQGKGNAVLGRILSDLLKYTVEHFRDEEFAMRKAGYPDLASHIKLHEELTNRVVAFKKGFDAGSIALTLATLTFLRTWLNDHILGADHAFSRWATASRASSTERSPAACCG